MFVPEWETFAGFFADMGERPEGTSLDRHNNDGPYSKENCRWATNEQQGRNRSTNVFLSFDGKTMCLLDWAAFLGVPHNTLYGRRRRGWSVADTLGTAIKTEYRRARQAEQRAH